MENILTELKTLLEATILDNASPLHHIKRVIIGDPLQIPQSTTTAILLKPMRTQVVISGNIMERLQNFVDIQFVIDSASYLKDEITLSDDVVFSTVQAINDTAITNTGKYESNELSLCGLLQKNFRLNGACHDLRIESIDYDIKERATDKKYTLATVKIRCDIFVDRP
jgi:hypothetical protein